MHAVINFIFYATKYLLWGSNEFWAIFKFKIQVNNLQVEYLFFLTLNFIELKAIIQFLSTSAAPRIQSGNSFTYL